MTTITANTKSCAIHLSRRDNTVEAAIEGDWVLGEEPPDLEH